MIDPVTAPKVLQLTAINSACEQWRVWWPSVALRRLGYRVDYMPFEKLGEIFPMVQQGVYDVIVSPRYVWTTMSVRTPSGKRTKVWLGDNWIRQIQKYNLVWIYEADDDLWSPEIVERVMHFFAGDTKPVQRMWKERYTRYREDRIRISEYADGFTVATEPLKKIVEQYTKAPVIAVPNSIDVPSWNRFLQDKKRAVPPLTIGWAGGTRDEKDFTIVAQAWKQVAELCPEVTFVVMGHISDALVKAVPKNRIVTIPWVELEEYPGNLLNFDIGCCALEEVPWNENKSANRWYEQTMSGVASVVSPIVYGREVTDGVDALIASTVEDWVRHLVALVDSRDLRLKLAANAKKTILNLHTTDQNAMKWMEAWVEIVEKARARRGLPSPHALRMA